MSLSYGKWAVFWSQMIFEFKDLWFIIIINLQLNCDDHKISWSECMLISHIMITWTFKSKKIITHKKKKKKTIKYQSSLLPTLLTNNHTISLDFIGKIVVSFVFFTCLFSSVLILVIKLAYFVDTFSLPILCNSLDLIPLFLISNRFSIFSWLKFLL